MATCKLSIGATEYKIVGHAMVGTNSRVTWADTYLEATRIAKLWSEEGDSVDIYLSRVED